MKIKYRYLTLSDLDRLFAGSPDLYEDVLALDACNYIKYPDDVNRSEAVEDVHDSDYKIFEISQRGNRETSVTDTCSEISDDSNEIIYVIHGWPGDAPVWAYIDKNINLIDTKHKTNLMNKFEQWYGTVHNDENDIPDMFQCFSEGEVKID